MSIINWICTKFILITNHKIFIGFSSTASIVGLAIVIYQIFKLKKITEITRNIAEETKSKMFFFDIASKIPKTITIIGQIQENIRHSNFGNSLYKFDELNSDLIEIRNCRSISHFNKELEIIENLIQMTNTIKNTIDKAIMETTTNTLKRHEINEHLENVKGVLREINTKMHQSGGEYNEV